MTECWRLVRTARARLSTPRSRSALCLSLLRTQIWTRALPTPTPDQGAFRSDLCRMVALYLSGGVYVDNDIVLLGLTPAYKVLTLTLTLTSCYSD